jgi:ubiquinol-cytochrome c reductase cytochrome b subunit
VLYLRRLGGMGAFLRGIHYHAASGVIIAGALYCAVGFVIDEPHKHPVRWSLATTLVLLCGAFSFSGFLLPMDQNAYWGNQVRLGIVESVPLVGRIVADVLRGGASANASTLARYYSLHVAILPFVAFVLLVALSRSRRGTTEHPHAALFGATLALILLYGLAAWPAPLEPAAAPSDIEYTPRPEWYFLWLFQIGKYVHAWPWIQSAVIPGALAAGLFAAPWLPPISRARRGAIVVGLAALWVGLTGLARWEDRNLEPRPSYEQALQARAAQVYAADCESCHGSDGRGDGSQARSFDLEPPDFTAAAFWGEATPQGLIESIHDGKGQDMPAFGKKLSGEEIAALVVYLDRYRPESP